MTSDHDASPAPVPRSRKKLPLWAKALTGVILGTLMGVIFGKKPYPFLGFGNLDLEQIGKLVITLLKTLATPLVFFAIIDAFAKTVISAKQGLRLISICLLNVSVAMVIVLGVINIFHPGRSWTGHLEKMTATVHTGPMARAPKEATLNLMENVKSYVPENLIDPFLKNSVLSIAMMAVLAGAALRKTKERQMRDGEEDYLVIERFVSTGFHMLIQMLEWVVQLVPYAVFCVVASIVGKTGLEAFAPLWVFAVTACGCLLLHSMVYYPFMAWFASGRGPKEYLGKGADAILTGLSMNSSLATVPITLKCLDKLEVSESNARLSACVGTNLNNDGITLYEALTALFLAQALGYDLSLGKQMIVVAASIMAGAGVAGIPEAGLIVLQLVLPAAGLPDTIIFAALPLVMPVDPLIARMRSGVNVMSDMLVALQLQGKTRTRSGEVAVVEEG